ncbi:MAG: Mce-associated rane protein [Actinomycetota bacterium]|jgi:hypothetical protein|nr:Mce-associated rane protein [Actinomycetota bacterium]
MTADETEGQPGDEASQPDAPPLTAPEESAASSALIAPPPVSRGLLVACGVLFALAVVMAVMAATFYARYHGKDNDRRAVEQVSGRFSSAFLTYDYKDLERAKAQVVSLSTGNFRKDYEDKFSALKAILVASKSRSTSTVKAIYIAPIAHDTTAAFIELTLTVSGTSGTRTSRVEYMRLNLVKVQSGWRVDDVTSLNLGQQSAPGPAATTTSTTTSR